MKKFLNKWSKVQWEDWINEYQYCILCWWLFLVYD
nr:hypothetical protein [Staphylococcus epidermidis]